MQRVRYVKDFEWLFDPTDDQRYAREPILAFSFALNTRNNQLALIADEILDHLDNGIREGKVNMEFVSKAGILMWLWVLGAYEVVRTMSQAKSCFSESSMHRLNLLKKQLAVVRMPDAKMEKVRKKIPVSSNRSPWCEEIKSKDLLIGDPCEYHSARALLALYFTTFDSITKSDILGTHESSYAQ